VIPAALKKLVAKDAEKLRVEVDELREQEREYRRSLGLHVEDAHRRVDGLVESARAYLDAQFTSAARIPDAIHHQVVPVLADAFVISSPEFAKTAHAAVDAAGKAGAYDITRRKEIEAKLAGFQREIAARELALQRAEQTARLEVEHAAPADLDRRASEVLDA
jgi:hypothetical protein